MNRIKETRLNKSISQKKLADVLDTTQQAISLYESGKREPKIETWQKLADFFKVSVPYIQGLTYTTDELIEIVHEFYFEGYILGEIGSLTDEFSNEINIYIKITSNDPIPREFYSEKEKAFPITKKVREYWHTHFGKILEEKRFQDINKADNAFANVDFITQFQEVIDNKIDYQGLPHKFTELGEAFLKKFDVEYALHDRAINSIEFLGLNQARKNINEYTDYVIKIRNMVNNFKSDSFNSNTYNAETLWSIKYEIYSKYRPTKVIFVEFSKTVDDLLNKLKKGDKHLLNYMAHNDFDDYLEMYRNYKIKIGKNDKFLDEIINEYQENYRKATNQAY